MNMSSNNLILFLILSTLFVFNIVSAEFTVLTPNENTNVIVNEPFLITWTSSGDDVPKAITIKLNDQKESLVGKSIQTSRGQFLWSDINNSLVGDNRVLKFYDATSDLNEKPFPVTQSKAFNIKPADFKPPESSNPKGIPPPPKNNYSSKNGSSYLFIFLTLLVSLIIIYF